MNKLAEIDTTRIYHEFNFSSNQLKDLRCEQWFIHIDLVNYIEMYLNSLANWNAIKILYNQINHFDLDHVKCVEVYYEKIEGRHSNPMTSLCASAQYNMWWKPGNIYYSRSFHMQIHEKLEKQNLKKYLTKTYEMKANHLIEFSFKVYEFNSDVNESEILTLNNIFEIKEPTTNPPIFMSPNFLFLKVTIPPIIMETEIFVAYHGKYLANLNIQEILALELANKDHRLPFYDPALDHDIQMHLETRLPEFYENKKLETYFANEFTNAKLLKYFIYKYRHCLCKLIIPHRLLDGFDYELIKYENKNIKIDTVDDNNFHVDIISPENIIVCSMICRTSKDVIDLSASTIKLTVREIRMDEDVNFNWNYFNAKSHSDIYKSSYIEIIIRTDYQQPNLSAVIQKLLEIIEKFSKFENGTIRLTALPNDIDVSAIQNIFLNRRLNYKIEFQNITFCLLNLTKWFNKIEKINSVTFIDCRILLNNFTRVLKMPRVQFKKLHERSNFIVEFRNMFIDLHIPISGYTIVYDSCCITPSDWSAPPWESVDTVYFKNMKILLYTIVSLGYSKLVLQKCQIEILLSHSDLIMNNIKQPSHHRKKKMAKQSISTAVDFRITFQNMNIEIETLQILSYKFDYLTFENCRISYPDNFEPERGTIKLTSLKFTDMLITPELLNILKYFDAPMEFQDCQITNENLLQIWTIKQDQKLFITGKHEINGYIYMELIAALYKNGLDQLHQQFKNENVNPFKNSIKIDWLGTLFGHINWNEIKIKSFWIDDMNIKLEYMQNGIIIDLFDELQNDI